MPVFRPSLVTNIKLIFDETLHLESDLPPPVSVNQLVQGGSWVTTAPGKSEFVQPLILQRQDKNTSFITGRIPKKASVEMPGYRQAGQFSADYDFRDLPIDPRSVRAAWVDIYATAISDADFASGMRTYNADGSRSSVVKTRTTEGWDNTNDLMGSYGVDEWEVVNDDNGCVVTLKGRDFRGFLLDMHISTDPVAAQQMLEQLDLEQPINEVVRQILRFNPLFDQVIIVCNPGEWPDERVPAPASTGLVPRHRKGAKGKGNPKSTIESEVGSLNFWDLIVKFCFLVGAIPYFEGTSLLIRPSRSLYAQNNAGIDPIANPTPFLRGRPRAVDAQARAAISPALTVRKLVYGRDVKRLSFDRKFAGNQKPKVIRAISLDVSDPGTDGAMLTATYPSTDLDKVKAKTVKKAKSTRVGPTGAVNSEEVLNIPVPGTTDLKQLQLVAQAVWEEIGRGELGGTFETTNLSSFGGDESDPDLIHLRPGDAVELVVDSRKLSTYAPLISTYTDHFRLPFEDQVNLINQRVGDENLARVIVATTRGQVLELQKFFRISTVKFMWSDKGLSIEGDFQNYIIARNQVEDPQVVNRSPDKISTGTAQVTKESTD